MGHVTLLVLLDLSAAFDTVDCSAYVGQLFNGFDPIWEVDHNKLQLMVLFLKSLSSNVGCLKVHALVPLLYTIYSSKLFSIIKSHLPSAHSYVDDTQLYLSFRPLESTCEAEALDAMEKCIADLRSWMINDKLMLNDDKTEFLVIGTSKQLSKVSVSSIRVGDVDVISVYSVKIWAPGSTRTWIWQRI